MHLSRAAVALLAGALVLTQGCASAPKGTRGSSLDVPFEPTSESTSKQVAQYVDAPAIRSVDAIKLPIIEIDDAAVDASITGEQADLVANRAARDVCTGLAPFIRIGDAQDASSVRITVRAIKATSSGAAGVSEVIGLFVPGPFRLPAGLGGFAADGVLQIGSNPAAALQWSKGANPITEGARISAIGDAYQLAGDFADAFVDLVLDARSVGGDRPEHLDGAAIEANRTRCFDTFGKANAAGAGASLLIGLPPESIDAGAPREPASRSNGTN
ncbi:MAG: hypothetical protein O9303_08375 [Silanimonas sp.]|jgi:hypothetical protein|nr:hypothetical protein [Silanimonas sp.]